MRPIERKEFKYPFLERLSNLRSNFSRHINNDDVHYQLVVVLPVQACSIKVIVDLHDFVVDLDIFEDF